MRRKEWFELHDSPWYPDFLRNLVTDALEALWRYGNSYGKVLPRLRRALALTRTTRIIDLCSGGGGPWPRLVGQLNREISLCLTDKYPNRAAFEEVARESHRAIQFELAPVDASSLPSNLTGFRTIFSSFHHFTPSQARALLANACDQQQGVAVFEAAKPSLRTMIFIFIVPIANLLLTPTIRPFRWSRLFWTYVLPVVPMTLLIDGWLSCLRSYSLSDMRELTIGLDKNGYHWEYGIESSGMLGIQYTIGYPANSALREQPAEISDERRLLAS